MRNIEAEKDEKPHHQHKRESQSPVKAVTRRADSRNEGHCKEEPAHEASKVGHVIDVQSRVDELISTPDRKSNRQVDDREIDDRLAKPF